MSRMALKRAKKLLARVTTVPNPVVGTYEADIWKLMDTETAEAQKSFLRQKHLPSHAGNGAGGFRFPWLGPVFNGSNARRRVVRKLADTFFRGTGVSDVMPS